VADSDLIKVPPTSSSVPKADVRTLLVSTYIVRPWLSC